MISHKCLGDVFEDIKEGKLEYIFKGELTGKEKSIPFDIYICWKCR